MELKKIDKVQEGKFLVRYDLTYEGKDNLSKKYEIVSRNKDLKTIEDLRGDNYTDAVVMILHDEGREKILLCKEYRMAIGKRIFGFPSGLVEEGEGIIDACARELKEETGLELVSVEKIFKGSYSAIGVCNEKSVCIIGTAKGEITGSNDVMEDIITEWYTKDEVREILENEDLATRVQTYCYMWTK